MAWWHWLIIGLVYYITSWIVAFNTNMNEWTSTEQETYIGIMFFGLGIIPMLYFGITKTINLCKMLYKLINKFYKNNHITIIQNDKAILEDGLIKVDNYLCFNIADVNYRGQIAIDVNKISYKKMKKIIDKLNKWGNEERLKMSTLKAIQEVKIFN